MPEPQPYLREQLLQVLLADQQLSDIVSTRAFIDRVPQGQPLPALVLFELSSEPYASLAGEIDLSRSFLQVDVWADGANGRLLAKRAAIRLRTKLCGSTLTADAPYRGYLSEGGIWLESAKCTRDQLLGEKPTDGSDNYIFRASLDFRLLHTDVSVSEV